MDTDTLVIVAGPRSRLGTHQSSPLAPAPDTGGPRGESNAKRVDARASRKRSGPASTGRQATPVAQGGQIGQEICTLYRAVMHRFPARPAGGTA